MRDFCGGVAGETPAEGVADKTGASGVSEDLGAQGETSPSFEKKMKKFSTFSKFFLEFLSKKENGGNYIGGG